MAKGKKKTHEKYVKEVTEINPNIIVVDQYINDDTKITHRCKIDGHEWLAKPNHILHGRGCPKCCNHIPYTLESFKCALYNVNKNIEVIDSIYVNNKTLITIRCKIDGHIWKTTPNALLKGAGCPVCSHRTIGKNFENSIWTSEHKEHFSQYLSEDQMKKYMPNSCKKDWAICPYCGEQKYITIEQLLYQGIGCICGDGNSYPNKFVYNVLKQLNIKVKPEYVPLWNKKVRYDDYLPKYNIIIENHGLQHYEECGLTSRTLMAEQENDIKKQKSALKNGINHYVVLDCRDSSLEWIKNAIMTSILPSLFDFTEEDIDWDQANEYATSNLIKKAASLFNDGETLTEIAQQLSTTKITIARWLKTATNFGWCKYIPKSKTRIIYCIELDRIFFSINSASIELDIWETSIINCLKNRWEYTIVPNTKEKLHWLYIEDAIALGYTSLDK